MADRDDKEQDQPAPERDGRPQRATPIMFIPPLVERSGAASPTGTIDFLAEWPEARRWLVRKLRRYVDSADAAEDIAQDIVERAVRQPPELESIRALRAWTWTVARSRLIDYWRAGARQQTYPLPDAESSDAREIPAPDDVVLTVTYRLALEETMAAMTRLPAWEWRAIRDDLNGEVYASVQRSNVESKRRHRARQRLRGWVRNFPVAVPIRWWSQVRRRVQIADVSPLVATAGLAVAALIAPTLGEEPARPDRRLVTDLRLAPPDPTSPPAPRTAAPADHGLPYVRLPNAADAGHSASASDDAVRVIGVDGTFQLTRSEDSGKPLACVGNAVLGSVCVPKPDPIAVLPQPTVG